MLPPCSPGPRRRLLLLAAAGCPWVPTTSWGTEPRSRPVTPTRRALAFPRDHGSHPDHHIEWWYITGHARSGDGAAARHFGFQVTFFRTRVEATQSMRSRFAARQLLFAHAAVTDVQGRRFHHDQRVARAGFEVAHAAEEDTALRLRDWSLVRRDGHYLARVAGMDFALDLQFSPTQPVLLQGEQGWSRKGPDPRQASWYYSQPQLAFTGTLTLQGERHALAGDGARAADAGFAPSRGAAWLDHEWSNSLLHPQAVGWDWLGINLYDGSTLTAFRIRDRDGQALWDGGSFRHPAMAPRDGPYRFALGEALFQPVRGWRSPLTQAHYPVEWALRTPSDNYAVRALLDAQELDSRSSTGAVYWEGLCELVDGGRRPVGRGYLEMTGYAKPLVL